ncbi:MAG TPA: hypothetical protein VMB25_25430 [Bryobacteraceae bacterium]|nr:hypothetical protein [Bryobacteraceae bacterium]
MSRLALTLLLAMAPAFAAVNGVIVNGSTNQPQANVVVMLVEPTQGGMQNLGTVKTDAQGKFSFASNDAQGPRLIRAIYEGVLYNKMIPPGMPSTGVQVDVYNSTNKPGTAKVAQHFIVLQPGQTETTVSEGILYQGGPNLTYNNPKEGSARFYLPPEANGKVSVTVNPAGGMPIQRPAEKTKEPNVYKIDYPIPPGETRFDLNYTIPTTNPLVFSDKLIQPEDSSNFVVPAGVTVKSDDLKLVGTEPKTQASIYRIENTSFKIEVDGTGSLTEAAGGGSDSGEDSGQPNIQEVRPRIYQNLYWILGMSFAILGLGSYLLYRNTAK